MSNKSEKERYHLFLWVWLRDAYEQWAADEDRSVADKIRLVLRDALPPKYRPGK